MWTHSSTPTSNKTPSPSTRRHAYCTKTQPARRRCLALKSSVRSGPPPPPPGTVSPLAAPPKPPKARPLSLSRSLDWWVPAHHRSRLSGRLHLGGRSSGENLLRWDPPSPPPCPAPDGSGPALFLHEHDTSIPRLRAMDTGPPDRSCGTIRPSGAGLAIALRLAHPPPLRQDGPPMPFTLRPAAPRSRRFVALALVAFQQPARAAKAPHPCHGAPLLCYWYTVGSFHTVLVLYVTLALLSPLRPFPVATQGSR